MTATTTDFIIIGGGMAGVSAGYYLAEAGQVVLLEAESQLAYHTTGRSAAMYLKTYGNAVIRGLTAWGEGFFVSPPAGFSESALVSTRGALHFATEAQLDALDAAEAELGGAGGHAVRLDAREVHELVPVLREGADGVVAGLYEAGAQDMDVDAIHQGFVRGLRGRGAHVERDAQVISLQRRAGVWEVGTRRGEWRASVVINAAGAWGDEVAKLAGVRGVGLVPKRRTAILFDPPAGIDANAWPLCIDAEETYYFKPQSGQLMGSPADETPSAPCDAQPEAIDIAMVAERIERGTTMRVARISHRWAGLRTFTADHTPVVGFDDQVEGFFWLVGQGGYGIQTSAAMGQVARHLATQGRWPEGLTRLGVSAASLSPARLDARD